VLVLDDASTDLTFERASTIRLPFPLTVLSNPVNQGYGGNQKLGYVYALKHGFDFVALLHGDAQYASECLPDLVRPLRDGVADACFGSRMMTKGHARRGGMPLYKFWGNRVPLASARRRAAVIARANPEWVAPGRHAVSRSAWASM
jgi:GT2 family glycosyltransferase